MTPTLPQPDPVRVACPKCRHVGATRLPVKMDAARDYLVCDDCGHLWTVPKLPADKS